MYVGNAKTTLCLFFNMTNTQTKSILCEKQTDQRNFLANNTTTIPSNLEEIYLNKKMKEKLQQKQVGIKKISKKYKNKIPIS